MSWKRKISDGNTDTGAEEKNLNFLSHFAKHSLQTFCCSLIIVRVSVSGTPSRCR